jgi:hypothetical protein
MGVAERPRERAYVARSACQNSSGRFGDLHQSLDVVPVGVADERSVGPVLRPISRLVPRGPTGGDGGSMEGVNRVPIHSFEREVEASSHLRARARSLARALV